MGDYQTYLKAGDGLELFAQAWDPPADARAVVCLVHGLGEHSGRYAHLAEFLNRAGYAMIAFDLRGHGKSGGRRGHAPGFSVFMDDIGLLVDQAARRYPDKPRFLYGHSLGGILALNYVLRGDSNFAGVIVTGLGLRTALERQTLKIGFARLVGGLLPSLSLPTGLDPSMLSRDAEVVRLYTSDPLVHDRATLGMAKSTLAAIPWTFEHAHQFKPPLLIMHGMQDQLTFPAGSQEFAALVNCSCTLKLWEGLRHELHNEPEKEQVFAFLLNWLNQHLPG